MDSFVRCPTSFCNQPLEIITIFDGMYLYFEFYNFCLTLYNRYRISVQPITLTVKEGAAMKVFDLHCDSIGMVKLGYAKGIRSGEGNRHLDVERLLKGGSYVQCFGLIASKGSSKYEFEYLKDFLNLEHQLIEASPELNFVTNMRELCEGKINAMITIEDSGCMGGKLENVQYVYDQGVRMFGIIHNQENVYATPNSDDPEIMTKRLTDAGKAFVEQLCYLRAAVDVSHLNYGGFWDVVDICKGPFVASHSCADGLHHHRRNLTDEMIRAIADHGGLIGINFCSEFATGNKEMMYAEYFPAHPARSCVEVSALPKGALVECEVIAKR